MKRIFKLFAAAIIITGISSCEKAQVENNQAAEPQSVGTGRLVSATFLGSESLTKACTEAFNNLESINVSAKELTDIDDIPNFLYGVLSIFTDVDRSKLPTFGVDVKTWRINYTTLGGYEGKENVVLTADVAFVKPRYCSRPRVLESISLYNSTFNAAEGDVQYFRDAIIPMRAAHNALVVYPFYQGAFADRGSHPVTPEEYLLKGRQAIDAELAALEFFETIKEDENISFQEDYYTECMGISNGGGTSLAVQYLLENELTEENEKIRLAATYIGEGCCCYTDIFPYFLSDVVCPDKLGPSILNIDNVKSGCYLSTILGLYYTWVIDPKYPATSEIQKWSMKKDYFSEEFLAKEYGDSGMDYIDAALAGKYYWGIFYDFDSLDIKDVVNPDMVKDGALDMDCKQMKDVMEQFKHNDDVLLGSDWTPKTPLHYTHSLVDEFVPYNYVEAIYDNLSDNGANENVTISHIDGLGHISASLYCTFVEVLFRKHPCPLNPPCPCED